MAEQKPLAKWSIPNLWEHFLVPEHRILICVDFELGFSMEFLIFPWTYAKNEYQRRFCELETIINSQKPYFDNADRTLRSHVQSMSTRKPL